MNQVSVPMKIDIKSTLDLLKKHADILIALGGTVLSPVIWFVAPSQIDIAITVLLSCVLYLAVRNRIIDSDGWHFNHASPEKISKNAIYIVFIAGYLINLVLFRIQNYSRSFEYFIILACLAGLIAYQIIHHSEKDSKLPILLQILILGITIRWESLYEYPTLFGSDPFEHAYIANVLALSGAIPPFSVADKYIFYPVFHVGLAMTNLLTMITMKDCMFLFIGVVHCISLLLIFSIGRAVFHEKVGFTAVLLATITTDMILRSVEIIPDTMVNAFFILILFFGFKVIKNDIIRAVVILLSFTMVMTHQLSTFASLIAIIGMFVGQTVHNLLNNKKEVVDFGYRYIAIFAIVVLSYWIFGYNSDYKGFFRYVVSPFISAVRSSAHLGAEGAITVQVNYSPMTNALFHFSYLALLFFGIGGILLCLQSNDKRRYALGIASLGLFSVVYGVSAFGIRNLLPGRWYPTMIVLLVILAAAIIIKSFSVIRIKPLKITAFLAVIMIIAFFGVSSPELNKDNPLYSRERAIRTPLTYAELHTLHVLNEMYAGSMKTDLIYANNIHEDFGLDSTMDFFTYDELSGVRNSKPNGSMIIVRDCIGFEPTMVFTPGTSDARTRMTASSEFFAMFSTPDYNLIYTNTDKISGYLTR